MPVYFFSEDVSFTLKHPRKTSNWIKQIVKREKKKIDTINYIFCSDSYLLSLNKQYLKHNTLTDIITFSTSEDHDVIAGDVFISIERVEENALTFKVPFDIEIHRVLAHGVLHLLGYQDKTLRQKGQMRKKEDAYLSLR